MEIFGTKTFILEDSIRMQAFKVCEEAFEVFQEAKHLEENDVSRESRMLYMWPLRNEMADVIQATLNLAAMVGVTKEEIMDDMNACYRRNVMRGRVK